MPCWKTETDEFLLQAAYRGNVLNGSVLPGIQGRITKRSGAGIEFSQTRAPLYCRKVRRGAHKKPWVSQGHGVATGFRRQIWVVESSTGNVHSLAPSLFLLCLDP